MLITADVVKVLTTELLRHFSDMQLVQPSVLEEFIISHIRSMGVSVAKVLYERPDSVVKSMPKGRWTPLRFMSYGDWEQLINGTWCRCEPPTPEHVILAEALLAKHNAPRQCD